MIKLVNSTEKKEHLFNVMMSLTYTTVDNVSYIKMEDLLSEFSDVLPFDIDNEENIGWIVRSFGGVMIENSKENGDYHIGTAFITFEYLPETDQLKLVWNKDTLSLADLGKRGQFQKGVFRLSRFVKISSRDEANFTVHTTLTDEEIKHKMQVDISLSVEENLDTFAKANNLLFETLLIDEVNV